MPLSFMRSNKPRLLNSLLSLLLVALTALTALYWQTRSDLRQQAHNAALDAVEQIDQVLEDSKEITMQATPLAGSACTTAARELRMLAASSPYIRAINLTRNGHLYCSSIFEEVDVPEHRDSYIGGQLRLLPSSPLGRHSQLFLYHLDLGGTGVQVAIDPYNLFRNLDWTLTGPQTLIKVGDRWIGTHGVIHLEPPPPLMGDNVQLDSTLYPYSVRFGFSQAQFHQYLLEQQRPALLLCLVLALMTGLSVYRWWWHISTPTQELRRALGNGEFIPYLQPIIDSQSKAIRGCEVLMRWQHRHQGLIRPDLFIPLAEESGLIVPMTRSLMQQVSQALAPKVHLLPPDFYFGFNICARHCQDLSLLDDCRAFLAAFKRRDLVLVLELTERELITPTLITEQLFGALHELGVKIALDDFGTGNSSLSYLQKFQIDLLKIDKSFVDMIGTDALSHHILDNTINLATRLGLDTVAEGVETQEQADFLRQRQVHFQQGYLYAKPQPQQQFLLQLSKPSPSAVAPDETELLTPSFD
ncbi:cyclic diguanylate phosphodiesterase [Aeromonas sp. BIGb0445]|uniref:cyclic diguanylate phosphodiesterase n=1 Tax=Aeromonas sp. BIGb0445 TaxID=2940593 RepID=UPI002167CC6C|nr:cyclic diguanylate phosphodiesterase [Aeromonas sp. BIGb0445]MCS3457911.1 sensor c-di-GMP phosphodiesterase-like protein [Aeromonas sp. BIGb0445]